jgi:hypothetical protein
VSRTVTADRDGCKDGGQCSHDGVHWVNFCNFHVAKDAAETARWRAESARAAKELAEWLAERHALDDLLCSRK